MKYLECYNSYNESQIESDFLNIEDILLEVKDLGYEASILHNSAIGLVNSFRVVIYKFAPKKINFLEVKDCLLRLKQYAGDRFVNFIAYSNKGAHYVEIDEDTILDYDVNQFQCEINIKK